MAWTPDAAAPPLLDVRSGVMVFFGVFAALVMVMGLWSRMLSRQISGANLHRSLRRFNRIMFLARLMIPAWFAAGLFALGWGHVVNAILGPAETRWLEVPAVLLGTLPPMLAWMGLWWSQYPAERALREQSILIQLDEDLPIHAPPRFWPYFLVNLRLQVLFTLVPVLIILCVRDLLGVTLRQFGIAPGSARCWKRPWSSARRPPCSSSHRKFCAESSRPNRCPSRRCGSGWKHSAGSTGCAIATSFYGARRTTRATPP